MTFGQAEFQRVAPVAEVPFVGNLTLLGKL
jgi:hypothetical protein